MSSKKWLVVLALLVVAVAAYALNSGGSTNHTSQWNSSDVTQFENDIHEKAPEFTKAGDACVTKGVEAAISPSSEFTSSDKGAVESVAKKCAGSSSNVQGILSKVCQEQGFLSSACQEEVSNQTNQELGLSSESEEGTSTEPYTEESGNGEAPEEEATENRKGAQEMNQELKKEEKESVENGEQPPTPSNP